MIQVPEALFIALPLVLLCMGLAAGFFLGRAIGRAGRPPAGSA